MNDNSKIATAAAPNSEAPPSPSPSPPQATSNRAALLIVFLVVFIDLLGFGIVLPLLPRIGDSYVGEIVEGGKTAPLGGLIVGLLMASFSLMQFLAAPIWGRISDRIGRRPILLLGLAGSVVFYGLLGFACTFPAGSAAVLALVLLFAARFGAGVAGATIATAQAVIADSTPPDKRKHGMALIGAAFGLGFAFGPLIGALAMFVFPNNHEAVGYTAAGLSFVALVLGIALLPETRRFGQAAPMDRRWINMSAIRWALGNPAVGPVVIAFFLATMGFATFETTLSLFLQDTLNIPAEQNYLFFAYIGVVLLITQGVFYRRMAKRVSEPTFMLMGIVFMATGLAGLAGVTAIVGNEALEISRTLTLVLVAVSLAVAVIGFAFLTPSAQALISRRTDTDRQGEILGVNQSASALARIIGPPLGITLLKYNPLFPYAFGALLVFMMLPMMPKVRRG